MMWLVILMFTKLSFSLNEVETQNSSGPALSHMKSKTNEIIFQSFIEISNRYTKNTFIMNKYIFTYPL